MVSWHAMSALLGPRINTKDDEKLQGQRPKFVTMVIDL